MKTKYNKAPTVTFETIQIVLNYPLQSIRDIIILVEITQVIFPGDMLTAISMFYLLVAKC